MRRAIPAVDSRLNLTDAQTLLLASRPSMATISKVEAAQRQLRVAVKLWEIGDDPIAVYSLAAAAREITTTLCEKRGLQSFFDLTQTSYPDLSRKQLYAAAHRHASFFKHADRDPDGVLDALTIEECEAVMFVASFDLGLLLSQRRGPEIDVFEVWFLALHLPDASELPEVLRDFFGDLKAMTRDARMAKFTEVLAWVREHLGAG